MTVGTSDAAIVSDVRRIVADNRDALVDVLQGIVRASRDGDDATQVYVAETLSSWGLEAETISRDPRTIELKHEFRALETLDGEPRTTVMGRWRGTGDGKSLMLWAHPDSVKLVDTADWKHDPFGGERENGRIYGWGVADDKSGVAAGMAAVRALQLLGLTPKGDVVIGSCASKRRAQGVVAAFDKGYLTDGSIYLHPAESSNGLDDIKSTASGVLMFRVTIPGLQPETTEPSHVAFAHLGVNPTEKIGLVVAALKGAEAERAARLRHPVLEAQMGASTRLTVTAISGGDSGVTRIPASVDLSVAMTLPPGDSLDAAKSDIERALAAAAPADPWLAEHPPVVTWLFGTEGVEVPEGHPLLESVRGALLAATDRPPAVYALHSGSDIRVPIHNTGTPCVGFGPMAGDSTQIGKSDEWVDEEDYLRMVEACALVILDWCGH